MPLFPWNKEPKGDLIKSANLYFDKALPNVLTFLKFIGCPNPKLNPNDLWLLRSYQLSVILRCLTMDGKTTSFDPLFDVSMTPFIPYHDSNESIASAINFFSKQDDAIRLSEFILDCIGLDLPNPLEYIVVFWDKEGSMVPAATKMPYTMSLYWDLFCTAGLVIDQGIGVSRFKDNFSNILKTRTTDLAKIQKNLSGIPSSASEIYQQLRPIYLEMSTGK
jgi:hypothetical protein